MTWNYRVVHRVEGGEDVYAIHEAYYDNDTPTNITEDSVSPQGVTLNELERDFEAYQKALTQPVLEYESFDSDSTFFTQKTQKEKHQHKKS